MAAALMERLLRFLHGRALPCVLDADALNLLARRPAWLADGAAHMLTPHPGEAARLLGWKVVPCVDDKGKLRSVEDIHNEIWSLAAPLL